MNDTEILDWLEANIQKVMIRRVAWGWLERYVYELAGSAKTHTSLRELVQEVKEERESK